MTTMTAIIGHRGAKGHRLENTLSSFQYALNHKITDFELDIRLSKDHVPMVYHDATLERIHKKPWYIHNTHAEKLISEDILPLETLLREGHQVNSWQFEIKKPEITDFIEPTLQKVQQLIKKFSIESKSAITSLSKEILIQSKQLNEKLERGWVIEAPEKYSDQAFQEISPSLLVLNYKILQKMLPSCLHSGTKISLWTVNDLALIKQYLQDSNITSIITDFPVEAKLLQDALNDSAFAR